MKLHMISIFLNWSLTSIDFTRKISDLAFISQMFCFWILIKSHLFWRVSVFSFDFSKVKTNVNLIFGQFTCSMTSLRLSNSFCLKTDEKSVKVCLHFSEVQCNKNRMMAFKGSQLFSRRFVNWRQMAFKSRFLFFLYEQKAFDTHLSNSSLFY